MDYCFLSMKIILNLKEYFLLQEKNKSRGDHAHKKLTQILINIEFIQF